MTEPTLAEELQAIAAEVEELRARLRSGVGPCTLSTGREGHAGLVETVIRRVKGFGAPPRLEPPDREERP